jgi:NADH-quinone oxidoreductase subunit A
MEKSVSQSSVSGFGEVLLFLLAGIVFVLVALTVSRLIRPNRPSPDKLKTYESGEEALGSAWPQFNNRFYIIALIFILFEVELVFLFPWATVFGSRELNQQTHGLWGWFSLVEMIVFVAILAVGLAYAWVNGFLEWVIPKQKPSDYQSGVPKELYDKINQKYS